MAVGELTARDRAALRLAERQGKPANLWRDAWERLIRNRGALLGGLIAVVLILPPITSQKGIPTRRTRCPRG